MNTLAANRLRDHDVSLTPQRQMIYAHLLGRYDHPNAEMVYQSLKPANPHLSKMTVYNVLSALVKHRLVERIHIENDEMRYDADMSFHAHFRCRHLQSYMKLPAGCVVEDEQLVYYGVCAECNAKNVKTEE